MIKIPEHLYNAETFADIKQYYAYRQHQYPEWDMIYIIETTYGAYCTIMYKNKLYISFYLKNSCRGSGMFKKIYHEQFKGETILTVKDCHIEEYCIKHGIPVFVFDK